MVLSCNSKENSRPKLSALEKEVDSLQVFHDRLLLNNNEMDKEYDSLKSVLINVSGSYNQIQINNEILEKQTDSIAIMLEKLESYR